MSETKSTCGEGSLQTTNYWSSAVEELVAVGAAIGCNCMPCLKYHIDKARELGVSDEDIARAVALGSKIKQTPARLILDLADRELGGRIARSVDPQASCALTGQTQAGSKCCG